MSEENVEFEQNQEPQFPSAHLVSDWVPDSIIGCVMMDIEAIGLPNKQEEAIKKIIKEHIRSVFYENNVPIHSSLSASIRFKYDELRKENGGLGPAVTLKNIK